MATGIEANKAPFSFQFVSEEGVTLEGPATLLEAEQIEGSHLKLYHIFVKFEGHNETTEWHVTARNVRDVARKMHGVGEQVKTMDSQAFINFYNDAKIEPIRFYNRRNGDGSETVQLRINSPQNGAYGSSYFEPISNSFQVNKELLESLDRYAKLFQEKANEGALTTKLHFVPHEKEEFVKMSLTNTPKQEEFLKTHVHTRKEESMKAHVDSEKQEEFLKTQLNNKVD